MKHVKGFTLIELLITISIIGILVGIGIPVGRGMVEKGHQAACVGNLRNMGIGLQSYLQDHQNKLPTLSIGRKDRTHDIPVLENVLLPYVGNNEEVFNCPADNEEFPQSGSSYYWNHTQNGKHRSQLSFFGTHGRPEQIPLISDKENWHPGGTNILYADTSVSSDLRFITE